MKSELFTLLTVAAAILSAGIIFAHIATIDQVSLEETSANFSADELASLRLLVSKAGTLYQNNRTLLSNFVKNEVKSSFGSFWNVAVYDKNDYNAKFYLTGTYDQMHLNKRYLMIKDTVPYGFSILILQTNNTIPTSEKKTTTMIESVERMIEGAEGKLQYSKTKSPYVTVAQEKGIDLAITTAYTWHKDILGFTKNFQDLITVNLGEHWQICTRYEYLPNFSLAYTSQYEQWIQYSNYGLGTNTWHVYTWKNYYSG